MIVIRLGLYLSMMTLVGLAAFPFYALRPNERSEGAVLRLRRPLIFLLSSAIALSALGFAALIASMSGSSILQIDWPTSRSILLETPIGTAWLVRMGALTIALVALFLPRLAQGYFARAQPVAPSPEKSARADKRRAWLGACCHRWFSCHPRPRGRAGTDNRQTVEHLKKRSERRLS